MEQAPPIKRWSHPQLASRRAMWGLLSDGETSSLSRIDLVTDPIETFQVFFVPDIAHAVKHFGRHLRYSTYLVW